MENGCHITEAYELAYTPSNVLVYEELTLKNITVFYIDIFKKELDFKLLKS